MKQWQQSIRRQARRAILAGLLAFPLLTADAHAEDPPKGGAFPPPAETPPPPKATDWSPPAGPGGKPLPPPRVKRGSGDVPPRSATPEATPEATPKPPEIREFPGQPPAPRPSPTELPAAVTRASGWTARSGPGCQPPPPPPTSARMAAGAPRAVAAPQGQVLSVKKTHNVKTEAPQSTAAGPDVPSTAPMRLQFDVEFEVYGQQGRDVYVGIWFARVDKGALVRSLRPRFSDRNGNATVQTRWTRVVGQATRYNAQLLIPYVAFPVDETAESYEIEARIQILRKEPNRGVSALARDRTTFRVYGVPEDELPEAELADPALDLVGAATPSTAGEIIDPGVPLEGSGSKATPGETGLIEDLPSGKSPPAPKK